MRRVFTGKTSKSATNSSGFSFGGINFSTMFTSSTQTTHAKENSSPTLLKAKPARTKRFTDFNIQDAEQALQDGVHRPALFKDKVNELNLSANDATALVKQAVKTGHAAELNALKAAHPKVVTEELIVRELESVSSSAIYRNILAERANGGAENLKFLLDANNNFSIAEEINSNAVDRNLRVVSQRPDKTFVLVDSDQYNSTHFFVKNSAFNKTQKSKQSTIFYNNNSTNLNRFC